MDYLTFFSKLIEVVAWPIAAVSIILFLRKEIRALIPLIKKFKAGPVEFELEQVRKQLEDTKKIAESAEEKAGVIAAKLDESDEEKIPEGTTPLPKLNLAPPVSDLELRVLKAMIESRFATRSMSGVAKDTDLNVKTIQFTYKNLVEKGLVAQTHNDEGQLRWYPTALGRIIANES